MKLSLARNIYPDERVSILREVEGQWCQDDLDVLYKSLSDPEFTDEQLKSCKEYLKKSYALQAKMPQYWLRVAPLRHLEGKDFTTGAAEKIDAVTPQAVRNVFSALGKGAGIEYITTKK